MNSAVFEAKVPGETVMNRRYAWRVGDHYEVVSRDAQTRYRVDLAGGLPVRCTCEAARYGLSCWHRATVLRRLINEGEVQS